MDNLVVLKGVQQQADYLFAEAKPLFVLVLKTQNIK